MIKTKNLINAVTMIAKKLDGKNINWAIMTGCSLALHGVDVQPTDIDILTDEDGVFKIKNFLCDYEIETIQNTPSVIFDSLMNKYMINGYIVEVIGDFKVKSALNSQWQLMNYLFENPDVIEIDNVKIPILSLLHSIELYQIMGRDKDKVKVFKIENHLKKLHNLG